MALSPATTNAAAKGPRAAAVSWPTLRLALGLYLAILALYYSPAGRYGERFVGYRVDFAIRHAMARGPTLDPKLKVFWYDDLAVADRHSVDLTETDWAKLLGAIQATKPRVIFIDKTFAFMTKDASMEALNASLRGGAPVISLADGRDELLQGREMLRPTRPETSLQTYQSQQSLPSVPASAVELGWARYHRQYFYGPDARIEAGIARVGQSEVNEDGTVLPLILGPQGRALPSVGFYGGRTLALTPDGPRVDDQTVPLTRFGDVIPNLLGPWTYGPLRTSMRGMLRASQDGVPLRGLSAGDTVVLLPSMFTGNTDIKDTPLGDIPGGLLVVALLNSSMTSQWLTPIGWGPLLFLLASAAALAVVQALSAGRAVLVLALGTVGTAVAGVAAFAFAGLVAPWDMTALTLFVTGLSALLIKMRASERQNFWLDTVLRGVVPPVRLAEILSDPTSLRLEPSEQVVTIVFIDVVGFSTTADKQSPRQAFVDLRQIIQSLTSKVHAHHGVIDRTLGDGVLCYFGCDYSGRTIQQNHAEQAVRCAVEIQVAAMQAATAKTDATQPVYPLRIGINTAGVFLGDLGDERRIDFTLIGDGVNFAQRLENSCEPNLLLVGASTHAMLSQEFLEPLTVLKKLVKIKHHDNLIEAIEIRPSNDLQLIGKATAAYWSYKQVERSDVRSMLEGRCLVQCQSRFGEVELVDLSKNGMGIVLPLYLARGVELMLRLSSLDPAVQALLEQGHLNQITVEVRWAKVRGSGYSHGVLLKGLSPSQLPLLSDALQSLRAAA